MKSIFLYGFATLFACTLARAETFPTTIKGRDLVKGTEVSVAAGSKGLVVVFLSSVCPCSNSHITELAQLSKDFPEFAFAAVHANADEPEAAAKTYFEKAQLPYPVVQDQGSALANQFRALKTPHAFVVKPNGVMAYQGGVSNSAVFANASRKYLRDALGDLQNSREVKTAQGRALGCVIAR